jgi:hypothetical protein
VNVVSEGGRGAVPQIEVADIRLREVLGQQPETGNDTGPAPFQRLQAEDFDIENVTGLGALDVDRPGKRVQLGKVNPREH